MMNHLPTIFYFYSASCCCCLRDFQLDIAQGKNVQLLRGCWCRLNVCVCRFLPFSSEFVYRRGWKSERWAQGSVSVCLGRHSKLWSVARRRKVVSFKRKNQSIACHSKSSSVFAEFNGFGFGHSVQRKRCPCNSHRLDELFSDRRINGRSLRACRETGGPAETRCRRY